MVKLNMNILLKSTSGRVTRKSDESDEQYLMRITHLYLDNKQLDAINREIGLCKNLTVLYLYDNNLSQMPDLGACQSLTHLYIQNNRITRIENLQNLVNLTKLYIGHNNINFVEGFHTDSKLEELYIENQDLSPGEQLLFDPRSIWAISASVTTINISGNNIDSLGSIKGLKKLKQLIAVDNRLNDISETIDILSGFINLNRLELSQNPICAQKKYRDLIIVAVSSIESLDGKEVTDTSRQFLLKWKANKDALDKRRDDQKLKSNQAYMTANEMRFAATPSVTVGQNRNFTPSRYSGNFVRPFSVSSK